MSQTSGNVDALGRLLEIRPSKTYTIGAGPIAARVEVEAAPLVRPGIYLEPFALRALGLVRESEPMIEQAIARFEAMGLDWHAGQTRLIVA